MATKTIKANVTIGVPGPVGVRTAVDALGNVIEVPHVEIKHVPPGEAVTLDAKEADAILAAFGGEEVEREPSSETVPAADVKQRGRR